MFDRFVVVDWSANSTPKLGRDSIWIAVHEVGRSLQVVNLATRAEAEQFLADLIDAAPSRRTLIGVDFSLGYPAGTSAALGLDGIAWAAMWTLLADRIRDDHRNVNNRFDVASDLNGRLTGRAAPFWGCPASKVATTLASTKPADSGGFAAWRRVEEVLRRHGRRPFSSWQLMGAGAVGSQSLLGIPVIDRLRSRFGGRLEVWPFTTGLLEPSADAGTVVVAEVWPSLVEMEMQRAMVRDQAQVIATVRWLAENAATGSLSAWFSPTRDPSAVSAATVEEGWVLGVVD